MTRIYLESWFPSFPISILTQGRRGLRIFQRSDFESWDQAKQTGLTIVSTDGNFFELATTLGPPPKAIWLRKGRHPTRDADAVLRREALRFDEFGSDPLAAFLVLERHE